MTNRKSQSSVLILATIGVYFGLVLIGATPQVLAQAAIAKQFNLKDEIERKDDLDKKPDDCDLSPGLYKITDYETKFLWFNHKSVGEYVYLLGQILDAYPEKIQGLDVNWRSVGNLRPSRKVANEVTFPFGFLDHENSLALDQDVLFVGNGFPGKTFTFSVFRNALGSQFRFESQQIPYETSLVKELYSSALDFERCSREWRNEDVILRHTEMTIEGDHLVITTRLPRGSLETLLADAK